MRIIFLSAVAVVALATAPLSAHDFWLAAANWTPSAGAPVTISAGLGERFPTRTHFKPRPDRFDHWRVIGASGEVPVTTAFQLINLTMTTAVSLPAGGAYLGVMRVTPRIENMTGPEFTDYLKEEGLDRNGRVTLKIDREGAWLIRAVHMVPLAGSPAADWESYWVTLSFHTARH